jgi:hypothetical protein
MLLTHRSGTECPISLRSKTEIATTFLATFTLAALALCLFATPSRAQGSLSIGSLSTPPVTLASCPGAGWYSYTSSIGVVTPMTCFTSAVTNCPNAQTLNLTYGYLSPAGIIPGAVQGVIVFLNGGNGMEPDGPATGSSNANELDMINYDFGQGYEVVQLAWQYPWEQTNVPSQAGGPNVANVQNAACRPATFLNYIYNTIYFPLTQPPNKNPKAGMCAQGDSAGSAAVAYSLAYYGAGSYLDNVELISGPVLSAIDQGCEEPAPPNVVICPPGQGCQLGGGSDWSLAPTYLSGANTGVSNWTNIPGCGTAGVTSLVDDLAWEGQSIVDNGAAPDGATPTFSYPTTAMSAWLCRSLQSQQQNCSGSNYEAQYCPNNSSPQGEIFYSQITQAQAHYDVYAADLCGGPEGATDTKSNVPGFYPAVFGNGTSGTISGYHAITYDMAGPPPNLNLPILAQCTHPQ